MAGRTISEVKAEIMARVNSFCTALGLCLEDDPDTYYLANIHECNDGNRWHFTVELLRTDTAMRLTRLVLSYSHDCGLKKDPVPADIAAGFIKETLVHLEEVSAASDRLERFRASVEKREKDFVRHPVFCRNSKESEL